MALGICSIQLGFALEADVSVTRFQTPDKSYIELFIYILGSSVKVDSLKSASVNVTYFISEQGNIIAGDRYNLLSGGEDVIADFMDLRRHFLNAGQYTITVELHDNNDSTNSIILSKNVTIASQTTALAQSDIQLLGHVTPSSDDGVWVKSGMRVTPLPYSWYRASWDNLYFYQELYHTDKTPGTDFFIRYTIAPDDKRDHVLVQGYKRMKPKMVNTVVQPIDIKGLSSGNYVLQVGVYDQAKTLLSSTEATFMRSNPAADKQWVENAGSYFETSFTHQMTDDSVRYALKAIAPKVSQAQVPVLNYLLEKGMPDNQRRFLHQYWLETKPLSPELAYIEYMKLAVAVDEQYHSAFGYGFETDRGHILLKYGFPNDIISVEDEPSAPPYEIWFYNDFPVTSQSDVRFLFYNPSLAGGDYKLLHSTAIGEVQNSRWQMMLYSDALSEPEAGDFINASDVRSNVHRRAVEYFTD